MNLVKYLVLISLLLIPINSYADVDDGAPIGSLSIMSTDTNIIFRQNQQVAYYDLRNRKSLIQITRDSATIEVTRTLDSGTCQIHVQIFQHDRGCSELDFFDELTANDTVVYDLDNIVKNDGSPAPINLAEDSYGYAVITGVRCNIIGNFRIVDDSGYEYRTNTVSHGMVEANEIGGADTDDEDDEPFCGDNLDIDFYANFNTVDGAMYSDVVGFA
ncbi:MAG: hypothetical protein GTO02_15755, partial [Candidatus Dadabacteria bacterium]|nr:hypothetical protein [Candidatus Dadabacteria bacterium]NIQ15790.1 hypothetical protein [Candidatus Dadabacteria bacterium]